jgi:hypothetical protein
MLTMDRGEYDRYFEDMLLQLNPAELFESLGESAVLLCWESPNVWCHRRRVAEWFESSLGVIVGEYGFAHDSLLPYRDLPEKPTRRRNDSMDMRAD